MATLLKLALRSDELLRIAGKSEPPRAGRQVKQWLIDGQADVPSLGYLLYLPPQYEQSATDWPLLFFLHGAGERGDDLESVKQHGPPKVVETQKNFPFIVVSPQCPSRQWWVDDRHQELLIHLLDVVTSEYRVDKDKIHLTGISMGGFGAWRLASIQPDRFASLVPICGGGDPTWADRIRSLPVWVFHGAKDQIVPISYSQEMVQALQKVGGRVSFTVYPHAGHDSWTETYEAPDLYRWLQEHTASGNHRWSRETDRD